MGIQVGLLDRLSRIAPKSLNTHIFANSGSEVVENAIKMARAHTKKTNIIAFDVSSLPNQCFSVVTALGGGLAALQSISQNSCGLPPIQHKPS